jgi:hypothetical protein
MNKQLLKNDNDWLEWVAAAEQLEAWHKIDSPPDHYPCVAIQCIIARSGVEYIKHEYVYLEDFQ